MVKPWSKMNFGTVVNPFSSTLKKVVLGLVRGGRNNGKALFDEDLGSVVKPFVSTLKKVV